MEAASRECRTCHEVKPFTTEFWVPYKRTNKKGETSVHYRNKCRACTYVSANLSSKAFRLREAEARLKVKKATMRVRHPTHRDQGEDWNGFRWDKNMEAKFKRIAIALKASDLSDKPLSVLTLSPDDAAKISLHLSANLKAVKYAIRESHSEAMAVLFPVEAPNEIDYPETEPDIPIYHDDPPPMQVMTVKAAAESLLSCETLLEAANEDLATAVKMVVDAEAEVHRLKTIRNEALRFLVDLNKELNLES